MVITTIGYLLLALSVLAVLLFCWLTTNCLSLRRRKPTSRSTGTITTMAGAGTRQTPRYAGSVLFRGQ